MVLIGPLRADVALTNLSLTHSLAEIYYITLKTAAGGRLNAYPRPHALDFAAAAGPGRATPHASPR